MVIRRVAGQHVPKRLFSVTLATTLLLLAACGGPSTEPVAPPTPTAVPGSPTPRPSPTPTSFVVTSPADAGPGTLRQALQDATGPAVITFDPSVFPPDAPVAIELATNLPELGQGNLTIDASEAGVILDGRGMPTPGDHSGIDITSDHNTVRGLQIIGFSDAGIALRGGAQHNVIGGDRTIGAAPLGQGNLISGPGAFGIGLWDRATSHNTIQGNYIGINLDATETRGYSRDAIHSNGATQNLITDNVLGGGQDAGVYLCCVVDGQNMVTHNMIGVGPDGTTDLGNIQGGVIIDRTSNNVIGPGNTIAYNQEAGVAFWKDAPHNTITQNSIHDNDREGIRRDASDPSAAAAPVVAGFDLQAGTVEGTACAGCTVEIFSDGGDEGAVYEGQAEADENGAFSFTKGSAFSGPSLTATAAHPDGGTSAFSLPTQGTSAIAGLIHDDFSAKSDLWGPCDGCKWEDGALTVGPYPSDGSGKNQVFYVVCEGCGEHTYYRVAADVTFAEGYGADRTFGILAGLRPSGALGAGTITTKQVCIYETFDPRTGDFAMIAHRDTGEVNSVKPGRATNRVEVTIKPWGQTGRGDIFVSVNGVNLATAWNQPVEPTRAGMYLGWHGVGVTFDNFEYEVLEEAHPSRPGYTPVAPSTAVPAPAGQRVTIEEVESALADAGYTRAPFYDETGADASGWTLDNPYEQFVTWDDGTVRLEVLNRTATRSDHMEQKLKLLDQLFPAEFMDELRDENEAYDASVGQSVSGEPDSMYPPMPGDEWRTIWGQYNAKSVTLGSYEIVFSLWFFQVTCPAGYSCWMLNFPGQEFSGDTSFVFYSIEIPLSSAP